MGTASLDLIDIYFWMGCDLICLVAFRQTNFISRARRGVRGLSQVPRQSRCSAGLKLKMQDYPNCRLLVLSVVFVDHSA